MSEVQQSPKDWPLAELKVAINLSGQPKELYFPLYPGDNTVGHNGLIPANEKPNDISLNFYPIIKSRHFLISCTKDPMIFIKSTVERPEDANAVIMGENGRDGLSMNNVYVWEFLESRRVCIGNGLITLSCTYLGRNRRYGLPRSAMGQTRIGREISMIRNQPMASTSQIKKEEPDTSITNLDGTHQVPIQDRPLASDATDSVPDEFEPMSKTLTLPEITQELERPTDEIRNEYYDPDRLPASNEDGNVDEDDNSDSEGEEEPSHSRVPSRFLPDDITKIRREPVPPTPDLLPTQPYVSEDHQTERTDHDALTQLLEPTQAYLDPDAPTQILDPALDYSEVRIKQEENTQLDTMAKPHLQPHPRNAPVHEDETADYQQGRVCETQSTHAETQSTQSPRNSPSLELEPGTASGPTRRIVERIPATPTDEQTEARRVRQEGIENKKSRAQLIEEEGKVPQTPEHAPVSQASTAELNPASGSRANSYDRSFGSGGHDDNNNDSVFHIAATAEDGQEGDRTRRLSCDEDDPMAAELQEGLPRAILKGSQEPVTTPSSSPPLQAPVDRGYGPEGSGHSRPSSRTSQRTKEGSPKHGIESDSERDSPKPSKLIRTESQVETTESMAERPTASTQVRATPSRMMSRRSTLDMDTHKAKVMISAPGLTDKDKKKWAEAIESLGGAYKEDYKEATILVFEGNSRTSKFMCAIVRGIPIVTMNWLEDSKNSHEFKPSKDYIFKDSGMEEKFGFNLAESCARAKDNLNHSIELFRFYSFYIVKGGINKARAEEGHITREVAESTIRPMIEVCGGKVLRSEPKVVDDSIIVIGPDVFCQNTQDLIKKGFKVVKREFILSAILHQKLDFEAHKIDSRASPPPDVGDDVSTAGEVEDDGGNVASDESGSSALSRSQPQSRKGKTSSRSARAPKPVSRSVSSISAIEGTLSGKGSFDSLSPVVASPSVETGEPSTSSPKSAHDGRRPTATQRRVRGLAHEGSGSNSESTETAPSTTTTKVTRVVRATKKSVRTVATTSKATVNTVESGVDVSDVEHKAEPKKRASQRKPSKKGSKVTTVTDTEESDAVTTQVASSSKVTSAKSQGKKIANRKK